MGLSEIRREIALLQGERRLLQKLDRAEVAARAEALVDHYVAEGRKLARRAADALAAGKAADPFAVYVDGVRVDLGPLLGALLSPTHLKRAFLLSAVAENPDRERKLRELDDLLHRLEVEEERLVCETGADRRPDARPEVILGAA
jgi:hypothetical protein